MYIEKNIFINGHKFFINKNTTINEILEYFDYKNTLFVLEYNGLICDRKDWTEIKINSNDTIEIISIVGGG
jgi:sulfur carrier protein